ncbi:MAG: hypothetical protein WC374_05360 [Phycisphaerae bacterium]|jgi:hypothetical protein
METVNQIRVILLLLSGPIFLLSVGAYVYVQLRMKPGSDLDDYFWEVEDRHPALARYNKWSKITITAAALSAMLLFAAVFI